MKKLFFTAIALVAFSSLSMAENTSLQSAVEINSVDSNTTSEKAEDDRNSHATCNEAAHRAFVQAMLADVPLEGSYNIAQAVYTFCMSI